MFHKIVVVFQVITGMSDYADANPTYDEHKIASIEELRISCNPMDCNITGMSDYADANPTYDEHKIASIEELRISWQSDGL